MTAGELLIGIVALVFGVFATVGLTRKYDLCRENFRKIRIPSVAGLVLVLAGAFFYAVEWLAQGIHVATAATYLLGARQPLAGLRGRVHAYRGMSLIVTYHPAFLLRDPMQKKEAWADLQIAMKELGLKTPAKA